MSTRDASAPEPRSWWDAPGPDGDKAAAVLETAARRQAIRDLAAVVFGARDGKDGGWS